MYVSIHTLTIPSLTSASVSGHLWQLTNHLQCLRVRELANEHPVSRQVWGKSATETRRDKHRDTPQEDRSQTMHMITAGIVHSYMSVV